MSLRFYPQPDHFAQPRANKHGSLLPFTLIAVNPCPRSLNKKARPAASPGSEKISALGSSAVPCDAHTRNDIVFSGVRVADRFDIEQRLIRRAGEQQLAFTDKQVTARRRWESAVRNIDLTIQLQPCLSCATFKSPVKRALSPRRRRCAR